MSWLTKFEPKRKVDTRQIEVKEIKQYLVDEFERSNGLENTIRVLEEQLENSRKVGIQYQASLTMLNEFESRIAKRESEIERLQGMIKDKNVEISNLNDLLNSEKITNRKLTEPYKEQRAKMKEELLAEFNIQLNKMHDGFMREVEKYRGTLSKKLVHEWLEEFFKF